MERLTKHTPQGNFETMMNYVYGRDGWAYLRSDGVRDDVLLTDWAKQECLKRGCDQLSDSSPEEVDQAICDCALFQPDCPVFLAYTFASQAVHMRSRLAAVEDILGDEYDLDRLSALVKALDEGRVVVLPCKVGDMIYTKSPIRGMVTSFKAPDLAWIIENISEFGKTVFLTRAEAEEALQKGGPNETDPV